MNKYFCVSPFVRVTLNPNGAVSTCCYYPKFKEKYTSLSDIFYGKEMSDLRQKMLDGEYLDGCSICYEHDAAGKKSIRQAMNSIHTDPDEIENPRMQELEFASQTLCNFKCITCNSNFSSAWENEIRINQDLRLKYGLDTYVNENHSSNYFPVKEDLKDLLGIIVTGGEPSLEKRYNKEFFEMLENNVDMNSFVLSIVTNNSKFVNKYWANFTRKLKRARVNISIDGVEEVGEFVRYGMKWDIFVKNLQRWKNIFEGKPRYNIDADGVYQSGLSFNFTLSSLNILNLPDTIKFLEKEGLLDVLVLHNCFIPEHLNPQYLPEETKQVILNVLKNYDVPLMGTGSTSSYEFVKNLFDTSKYDEQNCRKLLKYAEYLEIIFKQEIPKQSKIILDDLRNKLQI